jgi:uncharacterized protein YjiS (DUF1127 family)
MINPNRLHVDCATLLRRLAGRLHRMAATRRALEQLAALEDRELSDLGLVRQDLGNAAYLAARAEERRIRRAFALGLGQPRSGAQAFVSPAAAARSSAAAFAFYARQSPTSTPLGSHSPPGRRREALCEAHRRSEIVP